MFSLLKKENNIQAVGGLYVDSIKSCEICGGLVITSHECILGKKCDASYQEGVEWSGGAPKDHPCAAFFHATEEKIMVIDNPSIAPSVPGWEMIQDYQTGGRGHHLYYYARKGISFQEFYKFLTENKPSHESEVSTHDGKITIYSSQLGLWIGKGGRWAKAYQRLGFKIEFKEATLVDLGEFKGPQQVVEDNLLWMKKVDCHHNATVVALIKGRHNLPTPYKLKHIGEEVERGSSIYNEWLK